MARLTDKSVPKGLLSSPTDSSGRSADAAGCAPHGAILTLVALMARIAARETIAVMDAGEDSTLADISQLTFKSMAIVSTLHRHGNFIPFAALR